MTGRYLIEAALSREGARDFPVVICYEGIYFRDHWDRLCDLPWWYAQSPDVEHQKAWMNQVIPASGQDWMYLESCWPRDYRLRQRVSVEGDSVMIETLPEGEQGQIDRRELSEPMIGGWEMMSSLQGGHTSTQWRVEPFADTPELVEMALPDLPPFDTGTFVSNGSTDLAQWQVGQFSELYPIRHISTPLTDCYYLWGFEGMMEMIAENPGLVSFACERILERAVRQAEIAQALGAAGIWVEDCFTDMISPLAFEELNLKFSRVLVDTIHSLGMECIYYFCGDPKGKLELILAAGAEAVSLEESKKGFNIDIEEVADAVDGRCAVVGNLDAIHLLPQASEEALRAEVRRQVKAGRRNKDRFIMGIGSPVTPGTSVEQVRLFCEIAREEGRRGA